MKLFVPITVSTIILIGLTYFLLGEGDSEDRKERSDQKISERIPGLVASEELILELTKELKGISRDLQNLREPAPDSASSLPSR